MKRKIAIALLSAAIACCSAVGLAACVTDSGDTGEPFWTIETAYAEAQDLGYGGTLEEFLAQIQGEDGQDGQDGIGIADIYVDENGMLYVTLSDGGQIECGNVRGEQGAPGVGITGAEIDIDGNLILYLSTGEPINCGKVVGSDGQEGTPGAPGQPGQPGEPGRGVHQVEINAEGKLVITYTDGTSSTLDKVVGENGQNGADGTNGTDGKDGVGIQNIVINENGELIITLSNQTELNLGNIMGANGQDGADGQDGQDGKDGDSISGATINENGELVLTFTSGKQITVGNVVGADGQNGADGADGTDGKDGVGVQNVVINESGELVITLTNQTELNLGNVMGADGNDGASVTAAHIDSNGHLILTFNDKHTLDCGNVMGTDGVGIRDIAFNESGELIITMTDDSIINCGKIPVCVHQYSDWYTVLEPTCTSIGYETRTCAICGNVEYNFFEKFGHSSVEYSYNQSIHSGICERCGEYIQQAHKFSEDGVCEICGYTADYSLGLKYALNEDKSSYSVTGIGTFTGAELIIPETYQNFPVTTIGDTAFYNCANLKTVYLPETIIEIGTSAFLYCDELEVIYLQNSIEIIHNSAFAECSSLKEITIPNSVKTMGTSILSGTNIEKLSIPFIGENLTGNGNKHIGYLFGTSDPSLNNQFVPANLKEVIITGAECIGDNAFIECNNLTEINLNNGVFKIGNNAFSGCTSLIHVSIPNSVQSIGRGAFFGCTSLSTVSGMGGLKNISENTFSYCSSLQEIFISSSVETIGDSAFYECTNLKNVTISQGVQNICDNAFANCVSLTEVTVPTSVINIGFSAFNYCINLEKISIPFIGASRNETSKSYFSYIFGGDLPMRGGAVPECLKEVEITYSSSIPDNAFYGCGYLENIIIPTGSKIIGESAFSDCHNLTNISIPDSVEEIGSSAFLSCQSLANITFPENIKKINDSAFSSCHALKEIYVPSSVEYIGKSVFHGCDSLKKITIPFVGSVMDGAENTHFGYIFGASAAIDNSSFVPKSLKIAVITSGTIVSNSAFLSCNSIQQIVLPNGILSIDDRAFSGCTALTDVTFPDSLIKIGEYSFELCQSLTNISIPDSVRNIGEAAFNACDNLRSIRLPFIGVSRNNTEEESVEANHFGYIFARKDFTGPVNDAVPMSLSDVKITDIDSIPNDAFNGCDWLQSVDLPQKITNIGSYAFYSCYSLKSITIPESVNEIGESAFYRCLNLVEVYNLSSLNIISGSSTNGYAGYYAKAIHTSLQDESILKETTEGIIYFIEDSQYYFLGFSANYSLWMDVVNYDKVILPNDIDGNSYNIYKNVFYNISWYFDYIIIPSNIKTVGENAFGPYSNYVIYFKGTKEDWDTISLGSSNTNLSNATRYYYSETEPTEEGNYWYYDTDGMTPVIWTKETT